MNKQHNSLVAKIVRSKKMGGFIVEDQNGVFQSRVFESLDFARAALLTYAGGVMLDISEQAYRDGAESQLGIEVKNDKAYFTLAAPIIEDTKN